MSVSQKTGELVPIRVGWELVPIRVGCLVSACPAPLEWPAQGTGLDFSGRRKNKFSRTKNTCSRTSEHVFSEPNGAKKHVLELRDICSLTPPCVS